MNSEIIIAELLTLIEDAIRAGEWKVDWDDATPVMIFGAEDYLKERGWYKNSIDGSWCK